MHFILTNLLRLSMAGLFGCVLLIPYDATAKGLCMENMNADIINICLSETTTDKDFQLCMIINEGGDLCEGK